MASPTTPQDLTRSSLSVLFMVGLIAASFWILRPFIPALLWATMIVVAAWPLMVQIEAVLWGRRALAVTVMTVALLLVFVVPFSLAVGTLIAHLDEIVDWVQSLRSLSLPASPGWLESIPFIGPRISTAWSQFASSGPGELARYAAPYAKDAGTWLLGQLGSLGAMTGQFLLTVVIAAVLFARGDVAVTDLCRFGRRLAGANGERAVNLAGQAIRGVALGIVLVAIGQAVLGGYGWATGLLIWTIFVGTIDNVIRPILIQKGARLPLLLVIAGVIGGLVSLGLVGIFVGPVVLGVSYMLLEAWLWEETEQPSESIP
jgi:predicted PurR-regulated permease PerM